MKFTAVALVAFAAAASAQSIGDIPACAQTCLLPALQATGCDLTDFACSCSNTEFVSGSTACILESCSADDAEKAAAATYALCLSVGVTIPTVPVGGGASSTSAPPASSSSSAAPEPSETTTEEPAPSTTEVPTAPSSYETSAPSSYVAPSTIISTTTAGNTTSPTVSPPAYTGGAVAVAGNVVLALGGAVAAFFL
ncbi:hypothetical protein ABW19_dt0208605 [Dactylella cylindrospora]|nr:hypothetical protein ABW19_dt0208605 [Dactylella cylindrospora]